MTTDTKDRPAPVIHFLRDGRAICGLSGIPREWPLGHAWTGEPEAVSCNDCNTQLLRYLSGKSQ